MNRRERRTLLALGMAVILLLGLVTYSFVKVFDEANAIQQSRVELCREQNARHDNVKQTLADLDKNAAKRAPAELVKLFAAIDVNITPQQKKALAAFELSQVPASVVQQAAFINALAPKHDCANI